MKTFLTILMALFISHISFATDVSNAETGKNGDKDKAIEKQSSKSNSSSTPTLLPCTMPATQKAELEYSDCQGNPQFVSVTVTCSAERSTCEEATFAATQCAFSQAWTQAYSNVPNCPPVE